MALASVKHENFSSHFTFFMASVGFAVGLGNIWRFPYIVGENGGSAFVLVYLACVIGIGVPILMAEVLLGRRGKMNPSLSVRNVAVSEGRHPAWQIVGHIGVLTAFTIMLTYAIVVGWVLWYLFKAVTTGFVGMDSQVAQAQFAAVQADPGNMMLWTFIGLAITGFIIYSGVRGGIERAVKVLLPLLFLLLTMLAVYNIFAGGMKDALVWLFQPDWSKITPEVFLIAVGQAFFSMGVALGGMMTFGAYLPQHVSIPKSVVQIAFADTLVALLAGLVVFPTVFNNGLDPAAGPGLIFQTLPVAFAGMWGGQLFAVMFFLLLAVAGITSSMGLVESVTAWLEDHCGLARHKSAVLASGVMGVLCILTILSFNVLADFAVLGMNLFDLMDNLATKILLPVGGFLIVVFVGYFIRREVVAEELGIQNRSLFNMLHLLLRYVVPPAVLVIFVFGVMG